MSPPPAHALHTYVRERLLGATVRARVRDGRTFVGTLRCVDKQRNIVIGNAREYHFGDTEPRRGTAIPDDAQPIRVINMVLIGADERVWCEITPGGAASAPTPTSAFAGLVI